MVDIAAHRGHAAILKVATIFEAITASIFIMQQVLFVSKKYSNLQQLLNLQQLSKIAATFKIAAEVIKNFSKF